MEVADGAGIVVTTLVAMFGGLWGLIAWHGRRSTRLATEIKQEVRNEGAGERTRLARLEKDLEALKGEVGELDDRIEAGFRDVDREIATLGRALETVARQSDIARLGSDVSSLASALQSTTRQVTMLFEATLRREEKERS